MRMRKIVHRRTGRSVLQLLLVQQYQALAYKPALARAMLLQSMDGGKQPASKDQPTIVR
jgi:hypothetical protein